MHVFRKILCPVDFSEYSTLALRYACALARENESRLVVLHLVPDLTQAISYLEGNYIGTVHEALVSNAVSKTDEFIRGIVPADLPVVRKIGSGNPSDSILDLAAAEEADLIVMGTHGHTGYERFFLGSVTNRVLHKATIPVLTVCKPSHHFIENGSGRPAVQIREILCALDFDPNNRNIVEIALSLARRYHSRIHFIHVAQKNETDPAAVEQQKQAEFRSLVHPENEDACEISFHVLAGEPGQVILRVIDQENIDLLVMGHHSRRPIEELFLGSIAKRMVTDANCPVLVARSSADSVS
jgi:nucleotide-binding universal stress UspA family protein